MVKARPWRHPHLMDSDKLNAITNKVLDDYEEALAVVMVIIREPPRRPAVALAQYGNDPDTALQLAKLAIEIALDTKPKTTDIQTSE